MFPSGTIQRVKTAANIATVIGSYTRLRKVGQELVGSCVFHQEKTPSMSVSPAKGVFRCHGCGAGGDVLTFVQQIEGVSFGAAVRSLAEQHGISLEERRIDPATARRQQRYQQDLAVDVCIYWNHVRRCYQFRFDLLMAQAVMASDADDEEAYQHYARRAWRWGKILRRLDAMAPATAVKTFQRVRYRQRVQALVGVYRDAERAANEIWGRIIAAAAAGRVTEEQVWRMAAAVYAHALSADVARGVLVCT